MYNVPTTSYPLASVYIRFPIGVSCCNGELSNKGVYFSESSLSVVGSDSPLETYSFFFYNSCLRFLKSSLYFL
nr:MAG TPA: hypothetical protein [Caudoviricetes sp.]